MNSTDESPEPENGNTTAETGSDDAVERQNLITKYAQLEAQFIAVKEVADLRKTMLDLREKESRELRDKLRYFEDLVNIEKNYGQELTQRIASAEVECEELTKKLEHNGFSLNEMKIEYEAKVQELTDQLEGTEQECKWLSEENVNLKIRAQEDKSVEFKKLEKQLRLVSEKNRVLSFQMSLLNTLFTESEGTPMNMDRLRAIGKLVRESQKSPDVLNQSEDSRIKMSRKLSLDFEGIIERLDASELNAVTDIPGQDSCYQSMDSIDGPVKVLSVSRTFIKIKDLILEKKSLKKEIDGLKTLNEKMFKKVDKQEKRLFNVTTELNKTWSLVTTLESQQTKLHNSRSALRHELHEKRKILEKMKSDLSLSHDKWDRVKQMNAASQIEWDSIQAEFSRRRLQSTSRQSQSQESAFCEGSSSCNDSTNSNEETEPTEDADEEEKELIKRAALEHETFLHDPLDEFVSELVEEIEVIEAAADEEEDEEDDDDEEVITDGSTNWDVLVNRRALRLRVLEEQCRLLYNKLKSSAARNTDLATKLSNLHDHYGSESSPDPERASSSSPTDSAQTPSTSAGFHADSNTPTTTLPAENLQTAEVSSVLVCQPLPENPPPQEQLTNANEQVIVPEPNRSTDSDKEFVRLSTQEPQPSTSTSTNSTENSLEAQEKKDNDSTHIRVDKKSSVLLPNSSTSSRQENHLSSRKESRGEAVVIETSVVPVSQSHHFKIPTPPPMPPPPTRYFVNNVDGDSASSNLNVLGRLIIQQLPKRLEILKQENSALIQEALASKDTMREAQIELDDQKRMSSVLQEQIKGQSDTEAKLRDDLELQQHMIDRFTQELQVTYTSIENLEREKEKIGQILDLFINDRIIQENRSEVKTKTFKNCDSCNVKFTLLQRKHNCKGCGSEFCTKCTTTTPIASSSRTQKTVRLCSACCERKQKLDSLTLTEET